MAWYLYIVFTRIVAILLVPLLLEPSFAALPSPLPYRQATSFATTRLEAEALAARSKAIYFGSFPFLPPSFSRLAKKFDPEALLGLGASAFTITFYALHAAYPDLLLHAARKGGMASFLGLSIIAVVRWVLNPHTPPDLPTGSAGQIYEKLILGGGERNTDWHRLSLTMETVLALQIPRRRDMESPRPIRKGDSFSPEDVRATVLKSLSDQGLGTYDEVEVVRLLNRLAIAGLLKKQTTKGEFILQVDFSVAATKLGLVESVVKEISYAMQAPENTALLKLLESYSEVSSRWRLYPIESRWTFLKAVSLLDAAQQERLLSLVRADPDLRVRFALVDALWLMLTSQPQTSGDKNDWIEKHAPHLKGSTIWSIASEGFYPAGGLGRVQQYHGTAMDLLSKGAADVAVTEAYYPENYGYFPFDQPPSDLQWVQSFSVSVMDKEVIADVYYREVNGVKNYLIKDRENRITKKRYAYGEDGTGTYEQFAYFMARASARLIHLETEKKFAQHSSPTNYPAIIANDGQMGLLARTIRKEFGHSVFLRNSVIMQVTHTYGNRGPKIDGLDPTSEGLAYADVSVAVSALHRDEVAPWDDLERETAVTNGDDRWASRTAFRAIWQRFFGQADEEHPTWQQVLRVKREAKKNIEIPTEDLARCGIVLKAGETALDSEKAVFGYFGRLVREKAGLFKEISGALHDLFLRTRQLPRDPTLSAAFSEENLRFVLRRGGQVVLYANQQPNEESKVYAEYLYALARKLNGENETTGRLIVRTKWELEDQRTMLAATDAQFQDSWRKTEAAGYTESDASANGALQIGPSYLEGILQRAGVMLDRNRPGVGDTLIPPDESEAAYQEVFGWVLDKFGQPKGGGRKDLAMYQATAIRLSRPLEALMTGAEYLRILNKAFERKLNPLEAVREWLAGEPEMIKHFRKPWVRIPLAAYLSDPANRAISTPLKDVANRIQAFVITLPDEVPFVVAVDTTQDWWTPHGSEHKPWTNIPYAGNEEAFRLLFGEAVNDPDAAFEVYDAGPDETGSRGQYESKHFMDETRKNGWDIGIPYPGVQVLRPNLLSEPVDRQTALTPAKAKGIPVTLEFKGGRHEAAYLRDVPGEVREAIQNDPAILKALAGVLQPRPLQRRDGNRIIMQVPVRFFGGWGPAFLRRLRWLIFQIGLPEDSFIHLLAAYPDNYSGEALNNLDRPHDEIDGRRGEFYKVAYRDDQNRETKNYVIFRNTFNGRAGDTASYFTTRQFLGNRPQIREAVKELREIGMRAILDGTMHVAIDSPLVLQHPEFFRHDFAEQGFSGPLGTMKDSKILDWVRDIGFLVYAADPDGTLKQKLQAMEGLSWGEADVDGQPGVRFVLRHHESDYGPMSDTAAFNPDHPGFRAWYVQTLREGIIETGADGYRFDLASRITDNFWAFVKIHLAALGQELGKPLAVVMEDYRGAQEKQVAHEAILQRVTTENGALPALQEYAPAALPLSPDVFYNSQLWEHFRDERQKGMAGFVEYMLRFWNGGGFGHFLSNHDEKTPMGYLGGTPKRGLYLALMTLTCMLPGSVIFPWWEAYGWTLFDVNGPTDAKREWTFERFLEFAAREPKEVQSQFRHILRLANHPLIRDSVEAIPIPHLSHANVGVYGRAHEISENGVNVTEMAVVLCNLSKSTEHDALRIPIDRLGPDADDKLFMLYDHIHSRMYLYPGAQLRNLKQELGPWEARVYFIREVENPSLEIIELIANTGEWPGQGIRVMTESQSNAAFVNDQMPAPWELPAVEPEAIPSEVARGNRRFPDPPSEIAQALRRAQQIVRERGYDEAFKSLQVFGIPGWVNCSTIQHTASGQSVMFIGGEISGRAGFAAALTENPAVGGDKETWALQTWAGALFVQTQNALYAIQDPAREMAIPYHMRSTSVSESGPAQVYMESRISNAPVRIDSVVRIDIDNRLKMPELPLFISAEAISDQHFKVMMGMEAAFKGISLPTILVRRPGRDLREETEFLPMARRIADLLEAARNEKGFAGAWAKWKDFAFSRNWSLPWIGAVEGVILGTVSFGTALLLKGSGVLSSESWMAYAISLAAFLVLAFGGLIWLHFRDGVIRPNGSVAHRDWAEARGAAWVAMRSFISVPFIATGLAWGGPWLGLIPLGITAGAGLHADRNHRTQMEWLRAAA